MTWRSVLKRNRSRLQCRRRRDRPLAERAVIVPIVLEPLVKDVDPGKAGRGVKADPMVKRGRAAQVVKGDPKDRQGGLDQMEKRDRVVRVVQAALGDRAGQKVPAGSVASAVDLGAEAVLAVGLAVAMPSKWNR